MFVVSKILSFESNSQPFTCPHNFIFVVCRIKDTKFWKQFTTLMLVSIASLSLFVVSKILSFESNSQQIEMYYGICCVVCRIKDTKFWKQFTTVCLQLIPHPMLFVVSKILSFESNSQQQTTARKVNLSCLSYQRY